MPKIWGVDNFSNGIHTKPARQEGGERYAADIENLQIDADGFLRLRSGFEDVGSMGDTLTGVAAVASHLFLLREDGYLYVRDADNLNAESRVANLAQNALTGRISVASPASTYAIITGEGDDHGYWTDLDAASSTYRHAFPLGLVPPVASAVASIGHLAGTGFTGDGFLGYRLTWLREITGRPFDGMESNPSENIAVEVTSGGVVNINNIQFPDDPQITHLAIYRTEALVATEDELPNIYRRVATVPRGLRMTGFTDDNSVEWADGDQINLFNDRMPLGVKSIHLHNDRIFAPAGDRLVYSDHDGTIPRYWRFPPSNTGERPDGGKVDFCASHREVLLFGGSDGLFRLSGQDKHDFGVDQIGAAGPLDGYSWGVFQETFGFIGDRGLHVTDASSSQLVSDESLDKFFDAQEIRRGLVTFFTDNTLLFMVELQPTLGGDAEEMMFVFDDKHWVRWTGETVQQFASVDGQVYLAGGDAIRRIAWAEGENQDADLAWAYESNLIHGQEIGLSNRNKRFRELYVSAADDTPATLKSWVDNQTAPKERQFTTRDGFYPQQVRLERIGKRLRFRLEGTGPVTIRGLEVRGEI